MGLFGKLFDKKNCAFCGGEIGMLGNRKLEDGNMCKNCAQLLSPWFSERRHSTVSEIEEQLRYREANYERVRAFVPTRAFGEMDCLFMDDNMQAFTVTSVNGLSKGNPDIVDYSAYVSVKPDIVEHRWEDHDHPRPEGAPPRYKYDYDFYITIFVNHPYFDDMRFRLNRSSVKQYDWDECVRMVYMTEDAVEAMSGVRPDLMGYIRPYIPEPVAPPPRPMSAPQGRPAAPAPQPRPMGAPQGRPIAQPSPQPAPQPAPQPTPRPMGAPQGRPAPQPMGQPEQQPAARPMGQSAPQNRPAPAGQSVPQNRPAPAGQGARPQQPGGFSGAGRQPQAERPGTPGQGGPAGRPGPVGRPGGRG